MGLKACKPGLGQGIVGDEDGENHNASYEPIILSEAASSA
jgi:hypothetical protein